MKAYCFLLLGTCVQLVCKSNICNYYMKPPLHKMLLKFHIKGHHSWKLQRGTTLELTIATKTSNMECETKHFELRDKVQTGLNI
mgnify:CR=1 FL=1